MPNVARAGGDLQLPACSAPPLCGAAGGRAGAAMAAAWAGGAAPGWAGAQRAVRAKTNPPPHE